MRPVKSVIKRLDLAPSREGVETSAAGSIPIIGTNLDQENLRRERDPRQMDNQQLRYIPRYDFSSFDGTEPAE